MIGRYRSVRGFFADALEEAAASQRIDAGLQVRAYLIGVLEGFGAGGSAPAIGEPLALLLHRAGQAPRTEQAARHREVGDAALFVGGFFGEVFERRGVAESYVRMLGRGAYLRAAALTVGGRDVTSSELLAQLGRRFDEWTSLLVGVRGRTAIGDTSNVALVERWLTTRQPADLVRLIRRGIVPLTSGGSRDPQ